MSAFDKQIGGDHYKHYAIQPNEFAFRNKLNPQQANIMKYILRYKEKDGIKDLDKAIHVIEMLKELEYGPGSPAWEQEALVNVVPDSSPLISQKITRNNYFMIIGAGRCGTTMLHRVLDSHPEVNMTYPKEPTFWECEYPLGLEHYQETCFRNGLNVMNGDARTRNMAVPYVPQRVLETLGGNVPIIVLLRDPVERAISDWGIFKQMRPGREPLGLYAAMQKNIRHCDVNLFQDEAAVCSNRDVKGGQYRRFYIELGFYHHHLKAWSEFPICIVPRLRLKTEMAGVIQEIEHFLGIKPMPLDTCTSERINTSSETVDSLASSQELVDTRQMLTEYYRSANNKLSDTYGSDIVRGWAR